MRYVCLSHQDKKNLCGRCWREGLIWTSFEGRDGCQGMEHPRQGLAPCQTGWSSPASAISLLPCEGSLIPLCLHEQAPPGLTWCFQSNQGPSSLSGHFSPCPRAAEQAEPVAPHFFLGVGSFCSVPRQILSGSEHVAVTPLGDLGNGNKGWALLGNCSSGEWEISPNRSSSATHPFLPS